MQRLKSCSEIHHPVNQIISIVRLIAVHDKVMEFFTIARITYPMVRKPNHSFLERMERNDPFFQGERLSLK